MEEILQRLVELSGEMAKQNEKIAELSRTVDKQNSEIKKLSDQNVAHEQIMQPQELAETNDNGAEASSLSHTNICAGGCWKMMVDDKFKFENNREDQPLQFLRSLTKLYKVQGMYLDLEQFILNHLAGEARDWYMIKRLKVESFQEFKEAFKNEYHGWKYDDVIARELDGKKYKDHLDKRPSEYFSRIVSRAFECSREYSEAYLCERLSSHFGETVECAVKIQNIQTVEGFMQLLNRLEDKIVSEVESQNRTTKFKQEAERTCDRKPFGGNNFSRNREFNRTGYNIRNNNESCNSFKNEIKPSQQEMGRNHPQGNHNRRTYASNNHIEIKNDDAKNE